MHPRKHFGRGKNRRRNVNLPALPWIVAAGPPGITPLAVGERQLPYLR